MSEAAVPWRDMQAIKRTSISIWKETTRTCYKRRDVLSSLGLKGSTWSCNIMFGFHSGLCGRRVKKEHFNPFILEAGISFWCGSTCLYTRQGEESKGHTKVSKFGRNQMSSTRKPNYVKFRDQSESQRRKRRWVKLIKLCIISSALIRSVEPSRRHFRVCNVVITVMSFICLWAM